MTKENYREQLIKKLNENYKNNSQYNLIKELKNSSNPSEYNLLKDVIENNHSVNLWKELLSNLHQKNTEFLNNVVEIEFKGRIKYISIQRLLDRKWISLENSIKNWNCITSCCSSQQDSLTASDLISMINGRLIFINYINMGYGGGNGELDRLCCYDIYYGTI